MSRVRHMHSASVFVALMRDMEVCLLRRNGTGWLDGLFSLPAGGLDADETIAGAACREVLEEVGVQVVPASMRYAHALHSLTEGMDWVGHFFTATEWAGVPHLCEPDKHSDLTWCSIRDLPAELIPYVRQALICIEKGIPYSEFGWDEAPGTV